MGELYLQRRSRGRARRDEREEINVAALLHSLGRGKSRACSSRSPFSQVKYIVDVWGILSNVISRFISYLNHVLMKAWEEEVKFWQATR